MSTKNILFDFQNSSRDVYHTKRMFKVTSVLWSRDNRYILSGSTDHNVRLWKARASEKLGIVSIMLLIIRSYVLKLCIMEYIMLLTSV